MNTNPTAKNIAKVLWEDPDGYGVASFASPSRCFGVVNDRGQVLGKVDGGPSTWDRLYIVREHIAPYADQLVNNELTPYVWVDVYDWKD